MKRFILIVTSIIIILIAVSTRLFTIKNKENVDYYFVVENNRIFIENDNNLTPFTPNGVTLTATQPGVIPSGNEVTYDTYLEWFKLMQDMGLNTISVEVAALTLRREPPLIAIAKRTAADICGGAILRRRLDPLCGDDLLAVKYAAVAV